MDCKELNVVFIVDRTNRKKKIEINTYDLEMANDKYFTDVYNALISICKSVTVYSSPKEFLKNIKKHQNDVVLSIWSGIHSKSRKGLVPAICEAYGIKYVGADCYVQILCQDKALTKEFCRKFGIATPNYIIASKRFLPNEIYTLNLPLIVKPLDEGGSIGISNNNLVRNYSDAIDKCNELLKFYDNLLVEEYVDGYELCVILFGNRREIKLKGASMLQIGDTTYLKDFIWGYESKKETNPTIATISVDANYLVTQKDWEKFESLFFELGKVDLIRIDGRINENGFQLIELSPDPHIGSSASVAKVFNINGIDYVSMIKRLIENTLTEEIDQNAKKLID